MSKDLTSPILKTSQINKDGTISYVAEGGLTKREYFAAAALTGLIANGDANPSEDEAKQFKNVGDLISDRAVRWADRLIKALEKSK